MTGSLILASRLKHGEQCHIDLNCEVIEIRTYVCDIQDHRVLKDLIPILSRIIYPFAYDIKCGTREGPITMRLSPLLSHIQRGLIFEGSMFNVKTLRKVVREPFFYFLIDEVSIVYSSIDPISTNPLIIDGYKPSGLPLGGKEGTFFLDRICLNDINHFHFKSSSIKRMQLTEVSLLKRIMLKNLDKKWTHLKQNMDILVRVLSISKIKVLISSKDCSVRLLCNLLIADSSATCIVTAFDDAAVALRKCVNENDVLFIKSYRTSMYRTKQANLNFSKTSYHLQPKFSLNSSPTQIELKLNLSDLDKLFKVDKLAIAIPTPIWALKSICAVLNRDFIGYLTDIVGILMVVSRPEREIMYIDKKPSNQYWVRYWVGLQDQSTEKTIYVKLYLDLKNRTKLSKIIPGDLILLTQLLPKLENDQVYCLSTNETSIFSQTDFSNEEFSNCSVLINSLKNDLFKKNIETWCQKFKSSSTGGFVYPLGMNITKDLMNVTFTHSFQLQGILNTLTLRTSKRIVVQGKILKATKVFIKNGIVLKEEVLYASKIQFQTNKFIGEKVPQDFQNLVFAKSRDKIVDYQSSFWDSHNYSSEFENSSNLILAEMALEDCYVHCNVFHKHSDVPFGYQSRFELELHRYKPPCEHNTGVQIICLGSYNREPLPDQDVEVFNGCETQDIVDELNKL